SYRKWFGNNSSIVNWKNDGEEIQSVKTDTGRIRATNMNSDFIFKEGLTWSGISSSYFSVRFFPQGFSFSSAGFCYFAEADKLYSVVGLLNSKVAKILLEILSPTINFNAGDIEQIPYIYIKNNLASEAIEISKNEWNSREGSWDFRNNELIRFSVY